jgi:hypothetical protein
MNIIILTRMCDVLIPSQPSEKAFLVGVAQFAQEGEEMSIADLLLQSQYSSAFSFAICCIFPSTVATRILRQLLLCTPRLDSFSLSS